MKAQAAAFTATTTPCGSIRLTPTTSSPATTAASTRALDRGAHWRFLNSFPIGQFYHVSADMARPYNVYGGLQDNGTWMGPNTYTDGVFNRHWRNIGYGDGFWSFADPTDNDLIYSEYQGGRLLRVRRSTGEIKEVYPLAENRRS